MHHFSACLASMALAIVFVVTWAADPAKGWEFELELAGGADFATTVVHDSQDNTLVAGVRSKVDRRIREIVEDEARGATE